MELIREKATCLFPDHLLLYAQVKILRPFPRLNRLDAADLFPLRVLLPFFYCAAPVFVVQSVYRQRHLVFGGDFVVYNFDFSYLKNGSPIVTLSSFGIAFNKGAIEALGTPEQVIIGFDSEACAIGVRARGEDTTSPSYDFARRIKNDWIRIGAKDFVKYLAKVSGIDFLSKAKQFIAEYDPETETLIVVVDEQHLK